MGAPADRFSELADLTVRRAARWPHRVAARTSHRRRAARSAVRSAALQGCLPCHPVSRRRLLRRRDIRPAPPRPDARKTDPPAIALRSRLRLGRPEGLARIVWITRCSGRLGRIGASADGSACGPVFETRRPDGTASSALAASRRWPDIASPLTGDAARLRGSGDAGGSGRRRDAASGLRQVEKRAAGVPIRVRSDSPPEERRTPKPTLILARSSTNPGERGDREARAGGAFFPA